MMSNSSAPVAAVMSVIKHSVSFHWILSYWLKETFFLAGKLSDVHICILCDT